MATEEAYLEDHSFILPSIVDGPTAIGDLWDCRTSKLIGLNLFGDNLDSQYLETNVINELKYTLTQVRSIQDRYKLLQVSGEVELELLAGLIKIDGEAECQSGDQLPTSEELLCHYDLKTFSVKALPSAREAMDRTITEKLVNGEIRATHVALATILGADVMASIQLREKKSNPTGEIKEHRFGTQILGPISDMTKLALCKLDTTSSEDLEKKIKVNSKPYYNSQPATILEMFKFIEVVGNNVKEEKHPAFCNSDDSRISTIYGVPLRFYLVPIKFFLEIPIERQYIHIKKDNLEKINGILSVLIDFQIQGTFKKKILETEPCLKRIILDQNNIFVIKISKREKEIQVIAKQQHSNLIEAFRRYKAGKLDQQNILKLANEIDANISIISLLQEIQLFTSEYHKEFKGIHDGDLVDIHQFRIFATNAEMMDWYQEKKPIKVLLRTGGSCLNYGHVLCLNNIRANLKNIGVEVGIASAVISEGRYDISIKTNESERVYYAKEIPFVMKILLLLTKQLDRTSTHLFTIYASLNGIKLPFQHNVTDLHSMIKILSDIKEIKVTDSYLKLRDLALLPDGRWKFVIDLNALDSAAESVSKFRILDVQLSEIACDWIVGNYGFESPTRYSNAPLLFVFKDGKLQALCFDNVDILLLIEAFKMNGNCCLKLLFPDGQTFEKMCMHKSRADFALRVLQLFQSSHNLLLDEITFPETGIFKSTINKAVEAIQVIIRSGISNNDITLWGAMAIFLTQDFPSVKVILKSHTWIEVSGCPAGFKTISPQHLAADLKEFFHTQNPFYSRVQTVIGTVSNVYASSKTQSKIANAYVSNLIGDENCPDKLKEELVACLEIQDNLNRFKTVETILKRHVKAVNGSKFESIATFIQLLEIPVENLEEYLATELFPTLVTRLYVDDTKYPLSHTELLSVVEARNYFMALHILAQIQYADNHLFLISEKLDSITSITDLGPLCQLLEQTRDKLSVEHYRWLFTNPKISFLLENGSSHALLLQTIKLFHCQKLTIPDYIPKIIRERLQKMMDEDNLVECPDEIHSVDDAIRIFQRINSENCVPDNFGKVLRDSVGKNLELKTALKNAKALFYWSDENQLFTETWSSETISDAHNLLVKWKHSVNHRLADDQLQIVLKIDKSPETNRFSDSHLDQENHTQVNVMDRVGSTQEGQSLLGACLQIIEPGRFLEVQSILAEPRLETVYEKGYIAKLLPYIVQRLKMWGIHVIQQENLAKFNSSTTSNLTQGRFKKIDSMAETSQSSLEKLTQLNGNKPVARIDILACLNEVCHSLVFQDLIRILSQFPVALPLVLKILHENQFDYICLIPLLKNISVKWESQPGVVIQNQLFLNAYKMIVAFRVGSCKSGISGKSTILNQIMGTKHMFSSLGGPGADKGIPLTLHGSAEIAVLLQETCSYALWESVVKSYYLSGKGEVLMLVNMHGDALELPETIELLKGMATSFIAFFMPCTISELQIRSEKIQEMLDDTEDIVYILVDPLPECEGSSIDTIKTNQLMLDNTLEIVRSALGAAIQMGVQRKKIPTPKPTNSIGLSPSIFTNESESLLNYIKRLSCKKSKSALQLQKINPKHTKNYPTLAMSVWKRESILCDLMTKFIQILNLPIQYRLMAFAHLDQDLSLLTANESTKIRDKLEKLRDEKRRLLNFNSRTPLSSKQKWIIEQIRCTMDEQDVMSLGMEHLYRELGRLYQAAQCNDDPQNGLFLNLPTKFAELLINGHTLEILDGDIGDMYGPWLNSICHSVCKLYPDLRIFTVSIIGLQSSGKSTLLNALFACKFAVSVGRCTRGLFMRLIFLDKSLSDELNIDAIVLIDTEGLGAPEKLNDPDAEQKDRLLATFAMSVSNLTLINVLGESIRDLTDILQIVIVTMARLERADISPDILMVQHLSERDTSKTMKGTDEFCKALEDAVSLTVSKDMAMGVRNCKSLHKLEHRVKNGQILKQFRSFKNGASANAPPSQEYHEDVVDLYQTILNCCQQLTIPQKFHSWHELIQNYWDAVSSQDFSLRFKNIQEVYEFIERGNTIAKVKETLDVAFRIHKESCEIKLRQLVNELANKPEENRNWNTEKESELQNMKEVLKSIPHACPSSCNNCSEAMQLKNRFFNDLEGKNYQIETQETINKYIVNGRASLMKHLNQMAEALWVKHGWVCELDDAIESILIDKLNDEQNLTENERNEQSEKVWLEVKQQISHKLKVPSAKRRINAEVKELYCESTAVMEHFHNGIASKQLPELRCVEAINYNIITKAVDLIKRFMFPVGQSRNLDFQQVSVLESMLNKLPNSVLAKCRTKYFETGMVRMLKEDIDKVLEDFQAKCMKDGKLLPKFKWDVHIYAILKFADVMIQNDEEWNKHNNPYYILCENADTYKKMIDIRLNHGFGFRAEGHLITNLLLKAIRKRGQKQGERAYIDYVRSINWLTSSENVRLFYFSNLAKQVDEGDKTQALTHFRNPKASIEAWFKNEVDSLSPEIGKRKFIETVDSELEHVVQDIRNKNSCRGIRKFLDTYLTQVDGMEYNPEVNMDLDCATDFDLIQTVILNKLEEDKWSLKLEIAMINPSACSEVRSLLGCTEHCPWCGSLCWGQAGHGENTDNTRKHHACHQPEGLIGVHHKYDPMYLISNSCDSFGDNQIVSWHNCRKGMSWLEAKLHQDFVDWTFTPHNKSEFNELMKWFFLELHDDIAHSRRLLPARHEDLSAYGFWDLLSLDHILATIKSRI